MRSCRPALRPTRPVSICPIDERLSRHCVCLQSSTWAVQMQIRHSSSSHGRQLIQGQPCPASLSSSWEPLWVIGFILVQLDSKSNTSAWTKTRLLSERGQRSSPHTHVHTHTILARIALIFVWRKKVEKYRRRLTKVLCKLPLGGVWDKNVMAIWSDSFNWYCVFVCVCVTSVSWSCEHG